MFDKNKKYTRIEIEKMINPKKRKPAQGSYYNVRYNDEIKASIAILKLVSIYKDSYFNDFSIIWSDSIGQKAAPGMKYLNQKQPFYFFKESHDKKRTTYFFIGEVKTYEQIEHGIKWKKSNIFKIVFKQKMSTHIRKLFDDSEVIEKSVELKERASSRAFGVMDPVKAEAVGKKGESIFNKHIKNKNYSYKEIIKFLNSKEINDYKWLNEEKETGKPYDFIINKQKFDVKTTTTNSKRFYISENEYSLIKREDLHIVQIWIDKDLKFKKMKIVSAKDVIHNFEISPLKYIAKSLK